MLMNGKEVKHLVVNGEAFDKSYMGIRVEILNDIRTDNWVTFDGHYNVTSGTDTWVLTPGSEGFVILFKHYDCYYIINKGGGRGAWARSSDIKILD